MTFTSISLILKKKRKKMCERKYLEMTWLAGLGERNNGGHERALLASLAEITPEGQVLNTLSTTENSQFCSQWPSLHLHSSKPHWSVATQKCLSLVSDRLAADNLHFCGMSSSKLLSTTFTIITIVINDHNMKAACSFVCLVVSLCVT